MVGWSDGTLKQGLLQGNARKQRGQQAGRKKELGDGKKRGGQRWGRKQDVPQNKRHKRENKK